MDTHKKNKICLVSSRGGHLFQLFRLQNWWEKYPHFWVTFAGADTHSMLKKEKKYFAHAPESRNLINAIKNFLLAWKILLKEKPTMIISAGAGIAPPFFYVGRLLGMKLIFIEPYDFIKYPSLSAKMVEPFADYLFVQHRQQKKNFKKAVFIGSLL